MPNENLNQARATRNDEFYTQYADIQAEINAYLEFNPDTFRGKTVLLPCDDPEWSSFTLYFAQHFGELGLKRLISTSYAVESKAYKVPYQPTLFEQSCPNFDSEKTRVCGKIFTLDRDITGDGVIDHNDLRYDYLTGDGDFRSEEVCKLRDQADIIVTNPPFSLFRDFFAWIQEAPTKKQFLLIGNTNAITYKEVFPFILNNSMWLGVTNFNKGMYFYVPDDFIYAPTYKFEKEQDGKKVNRVSTCCWFTNLDHGRRHHPLALMSMADNLRFSNHSQIRGREAYDRYDNYDAIEVPYVDAIPNDYEGVMGVPITFLDKYCPEQFDIINPYEVKINKEYKVFPLLAPGADGWEINGKKKYARIFIKKRQ